MRSWSAVVMGPSQVPTSSDRNGQRSSRVFTLKVRVLSIDSYPLLTLPTELITSSQLTQHSHLKLVGLVGSIDNDMSMTDLTIGAPTALQRICEAIDNINSTAYSHSRAFVVEVMGRDCGWLALLAGVACVSAFLFASQLKPFSNRGGADFIFIPERPPKVDVWEDHMYDEIKRVSCPLHYP